MSRFFNWLDHRTGYRDLMREALYEKIPGGARWRYVWGSTLVFTFFLQLITGIFLWTAYSPSAQTAWESVYFIQEVMTLGWLVRGIHHFAAQAMVVLLALHLMQVILDGAYKAPREVNFWLGIILMMIVLGLSLTGYLLPWDQKGYYGTKVATNIMGATPVVGTGMKAVLLGGSDYGHHTLTRFFALHAGILPGLLIFFLVLHIYVFRRHGIHVKDPDRAPTTTFWPDQVLKDAVACLAVFAVVLLLACTKGAELGAPTDPSVAYAAARPEWYFLFLFRFLKFEFIDSFGVAFGAIYIPGALMLFLILMPLIAIWRHGHKLNVAFTMLMLVAVSGLTVLAVYDDWYSDHPQSVEFRNDVAESHQAAERVKELAAGPDAIPVSGAVTLLRQDPLTQGRQLFAAKCAACHRYDGHNGKGFPVLVGGKETPATAADLGKFGSRDWLRDVLVSYGKVFEPINNATRDGESLGPLYLGDDAMMAAWSRENQEVLNDPKNEAKLRALIEFVVSQSQRADLAPFDDALVAEGRTIFETGELAEGSFSSACVDCHAIHPAGEKAMLGDFGGAPSLVGYGGRGWLTRFIANPSADEFYGYDSSKCIMPGFEESLEPSELDLLVRWMIGDYYRAPQTTE